jgi:hypothetical protein
MWENTRDWDLERASIPADASVHFHLVALDPDRDDPDPDYCFPSEWVVFRLLGWSWFHQSENTSLDINYALLVFPAGCQCSFGLTGYVTMKSSMTIVGFDSIQRSPQDSIVNVER